MFDEGCWPKRRKLRRPKTTRSRSGSFVRVDFEIKIQFLVLALVFNLLKKVIIPVQFACYLSVHCLILFLK